MLQQVADMITANIDEITRRWVEELRRSERTEIHNQLLTSEIVTSTKGMLASLAEALAMREMPDHENAPIITLPRLYRTGSLSPPRLPRGTAPLNTPLSRAQSAASAHGVLRHNQNFEIHEVVLEYVKLRQVLWELVRANVPPDQTAELLQVMQYLDRLVDELMLCTVEHFYSASVRDLEKRALRDPLTQLYNKEYFAQRLGEELRRAMRSGRASHGCHDRHGPPERGQRYVWAPGGRFGDYSGSLGDTRYMPPERYTLPLWGRRIRGDPPRNRQGHRRECLPSGSCVPCIT